MWGSTSSAVMEARVILACFSSDSKAARDAEEFVSTLKVDLFADEVFVFTPNGDVKSLPPCRGCSPIRCSTPECR